MIKIFNANDRVFDTAGNITINPLKCMENKKKSLNGWYIDVEVPIYYKDYIEQDKLCVVKTKSKLNPQAFRIENIEYTTRKIVFRAKHVLFDAENYFLLDVRPTNLNGQNALSYINERTDERSPFTVYSNITKVSTSYFIRKNLLEAWSTLEERWGGVFDADNWNISFLAKVGSDNGETVYYGQNIENMQVYEDWSNVVTKLYPVGYDGLMLPEKCLESDIQYSEPYTKTINFTTELDINAVTKKELLDELRIKANNYLEDNKVPKVSYVITANVSKKLDIGDTVHVKHPLCNILTEVLEYEYNIISEKMISVVFGNYSRDIKTKFNSIKENINKVIEQLSNQNIVINNQTELINSLNKNGHVYIDQNEILILDVIPKENAKNVWRFGLAGIGFSSNGYEGPFETAITMDGQINANFITTGVMSVNRIEGLSNALNNILVEIQLNADNISSIVQKNAKYKESIKGVTEIHISDAGKAEILKLEIQGNKTYNNYLFPSDNLYPSEDLYPNMGVI